MVGRGGFGGALLPAAFYIQGVTETLGTPTDVCRRD
jgi:hypothetical protein